ncbi:hypothetical protein LCGC14_2156400 [marine sediment metagenome]|uniref:Uncharacterized protein n=1 Tax=marine sediment metagenome TaxID=412755 RepID=A0A0F9EGC8_9ZZZZ
MSTKDELYNEDIEFLRTITKELRNFASIQKAEAVKLENIIFRFEEREV